MEPDNEIYPVVVFESNKWEASMVQSLLANAEIESYLKDERMGVLAPWNVSPGGATAVKVVVSNLDVEKAREVIEQFEKAEREK